MLATVFIFLLLQVVGLCNAKCESYSLYLEHVNDGSIASTKVKLENNSGQQWNIPVFMWRNQCKNIVAMRSEDKSFRVFGYPCNPSTITVDLDEKLMIALRLEKPNKVYQNHNKLRWVNEYWFAWDDTSHKIC